jgi:hypothetical protein
MAGARLLLAAHLKTRLTPHMSGTAEERHETYVTSQFRHRISTWSQQKRCRFTILDGYEGVGNSKFVQFTT